MKNFIIRNLSRIPESRLKNSIRKFLLDRYAGLPAPLMVNRGDRILVAGIRHPASVCKWVNATGERGELILVEADQRNIDTLTQHIEEKGYNNIKLLRCALGKQEGEARFQVSDRPSDNRLKNDTIKMDNDLREDYVEEIVVPVKSIDSIVSELNLDKIDFISLTINGAELDAVAGMSIANQRVLRVYSKAHAIDEEKGQPINQQIATILGQYGFTASISKPTPGIVENWEERAGDVYAWRN